VKSTKHKAPVVAKAVAGRQNPKAQTPTQRVIYFYGEDTWAARQAIAEMASAGAAQLRFLDREDLEQDGLNGAGGASLFGRVLTVVRDPSHLPSRLQEAVIAAFAGLAVEAVLWDRGAPQRRSLVFRTFRQSARVFSIPDERALAAWTEAAARERGVTLTAAQAAALAAAVGGDRWRIGNILDMAAARGSFTVEAGADSGDDIFAVMQALAAGKQTAALDGIRSLLAAGHSEFYLLSMLAYQFRTLFIIRSGLDARLQHFALVRDGKLKAYTVQQNMAVARSRSAAFWHEALTRVLATDTAIRSGTLEARTAVLMLAGSLLAAG